MRTHTKTFHIRFTEKEYERLCKHADKAGLPKTTYIRHMINGGSPKENPSDVFWALLKEIHFIGNNLNQLCRMAHRFGNLNTGKLDEALKEHNQICSKFFSQVILPEKLDISATLEQGRRLAETEQNKEVEPHV